HVRLGDDAADQDADVAEAGVVEEPKDARHEGHVGAAEEAEAEPGGVLVGDGADDGLGRLPESGVDDVHAGVAEGAGDHLDAAVVAVEADLGQHDADRGGGCHLGSSLVVGYSKNPRTGARNSPSTSGSVKSWSCPKTRGG